MTSSLNRLKYTVNESNSNQIYNHLELINHLFLPPLDSYVNLKTYSLKIHKSAIKFECWEDKKLIGLVAVYLNDKESKRGYITNVSILDNYTGFGIASLLIARSIKKAKELGFNYIDLEVFKNNINALNLYKKLGFLVYSTSQNKIIMRKNILSS
jgi:ribosomal protein S18 acetylase RimI-like enzyme